MRLLLSYHYFRTTDLDALYTKSFTEPYPETFADSGAFSAFTQGAEIDIAEYAEWLTRWGHLFVTRANLDVIGDAEKAAQATWDNQHRLEDLTQSYILPVFHAGEPWEWLDRYLEAGYPYMALGGLVGRKARDIMPWLIRCFQTARATGTKFHGFGLTIHEALNALPFYSVDSTSWGAGYRYGTVRVFDDTIGKFRLIYCNDHQRVYTPDNVRLLRSHGMDPAHFATRDGYTREEMCKVGAVAWWRYEQYLRKRHGPIVLANRPEGVIGYCADGSFQNLVDGFDGLRLYLAENDKANLPAMQHAIKEAT